jgi:uncharacterized protein YkwD
MRLICLISLIISLATVLPVQAQVSSRTAEFQVLNLLNQYRQRMKLSPLKLDRSASDVARLHSEEMAERNFFDLRSPSRGSLEYQLSYHRVSGRILNSLIVLDYSIPEVFSQLQKNPQLLDDSVTHAGVGVHMDDQSHPEKGIWLTLVYLEYLAEIKPVPRTVSPGEILRLRGEIYAPYQRARMPVTLPNGQVKTYPNLLGNRRGFLFEIPFSQGKGRYTLELLVDDPQQGPRVAAILPIYAGQAYPSAEPSPSPSQEQFASTTEAAQRLFWLINQERQRHRLPVLQEDQLLEQISWQHSEDMGKNKYFAHISPKGEDPNERFHRAGGKGQVGENIAFDISIEGAHRRLMNSPGHRANILDPRFTHLGVGVYFNGSHYYITQLFRRKNLPLDSHAVSQSFMRWLNQQRTRYRLPALQNDERIHDAALQHSQAMARENRLSYQVGGLSFNERLQRLRAQTGEVNTILVLADSVENALEKLAKHTPMIAQKKFKKTGIGVFQAVSSDYGDNSLWITPAVGTKSAY